MCGISGIINKSNDSVNEKDIQDINDLIIHRGPDGFGYFYGENFAFGHRRLSIVDLTELGHQPMNYIDKYTIIYNGEIYNYKEIKSDLIKNGYQFTSKTDTEIILASYDKWGKECVHKFNGMWAFAIYDKEKKIIFCSRDRFGIKPFYYMNQDRKFIFGSEIKQCLHFCDNKVANNEVLIDFLVTSFAEHKDTTFFKNIMKLPASSNLIYDLSTHQFIIERYYEIPQNNSLKEKTSKEKIKNYQAALEDSVKLRLRSDVRVGTCLSGGLDSSTVAAIASENYQSKERFSAIHAQSTEQKTDESHYAQSVAQHCKLDLHTITPKTEEFISLIDEVVYTQEEPFVSPSIFMQYFVMKKARKIGCKVMLDGQGGDETLLGYEKYFPLAYIDILKEHGIISMLKAIYLSNKKNKKMSIKWILLYWFGGLFGSLRQRFYWQRSNFIKKKYRQKNFEYLRELSKLYYNSFELQKHEMARTNLPILLRYEDKNSMRNSIETRLPYIDYRVVETALNLSCQLKIKDGWTKYILRMVGQNYLPKSVIWRKNKLGFNAPDKTWLSSHSDQIKQTILKSNLIQNLSDMPVLLKKYNSLPLLNIWRLYSIAKWEEVYNVSFDKS